MRGCSSSWSESGSRGAIPERRRAGPAADTFSVSGGGVAEVEAVARRVSAALVLRPRSRRQLRARNLLRVARVRSRGRARSERDHRCSSCCGIVPSRPPAARLTPRSLRRRRSGSRSPSPSSSSIRPEDAFIAMAAARGDYDAVLVSSTDSGTELCARLARELSVVAIDLGVAFERLLYPSDASRLRAGATVGRGPVRARARRAIATAPARGPPGARTRNHERVLHRARARPEADPSADD